jgi:23S rRNA (uridine2552-2'-O)-methyltransferase
MSTNVWQCDFIMSNKQWRDKHFNDPYVKKAQKDGYVCRAAYKLLEIHQRYCVFKKGIHVVDLGAAPGGWSQVAVNLVGNAGTIVGIDLLPLKTPLAIDFIQGDFTDSHCFEDVLRRSGSTVDVVMSDMAPNLSGNKLVDQMKSVHLVELALHFAVQVLTPEGFFIAKLFHGSGFDELVKQVSLEFMRVSIFKPKSSRSESSEVFVVATAKRD